MKKLSELLQDVAVKQYWGSLDVPIRKICTDSRQCGDGDLFVAIRGTQVDGHRFIGDALAQGVQAIVAETAPHDRCLLDRTTWIQVANSRQALALLARNYYERPDEHLAIVGVTGTNGKTTVVHLLYETGRLLGYPVGKIGTIAYEWNDHRLRASHTTPDPLTLYRLLRQMADDGISHVFMEVSSHALDQHRVDGLRFTGAIFTNISHDHLDYHGDMHAYVEAKKRLFDILDEQAWALVNADDRYSRHLTANTRARVYTYGLRRPADFHARILEMHMEGTLLEIDGQTIHTLQPGLHNVYNFLAAYGGWRLLEPERPADELLKALSRVPLPAGRLQTIRVGPYTAIVDYAHTPDALKKVLETLQHLRKPSQRIITVIGAGGNRDPSKRPALGAVAALMSDIAIFTSDNPRWEPPEAIIRDMTQDLNALLRRKVITITDRREALRTAAALAHPGDLILVAGKGHETYQEIQGQRLPFSDAEEIAKALEEKQN